MRRYLYILFVFLSFQSYGQFSSTLLTTVDSVNVGEVFDAKIRISKPINAQFDALDISTLFEPITLQNAIAPPDSLGNYEVPDFEIESMGGWNNFRDNKRVPFASFEWTKDPSLNKSYADNSIEIRFWDPGVYKLKAGEFIFKDSSQNAIPLEGTLLFVRPPEMNIDTTQEVPIKPIKSIFRESSSWKDYWLIMLGVLLLCALVFLLIRYRAKKDALVEQEIVEPYRAPHIIALEKLEDLKAQQLWQKGEVKTYQSKLTEIIRGYINKRYGVPALEMTTDEITRGLQGKNFNPLYETQLREILTMADLIKFAKAKPPADIHDRFMDTAVNFVQNTQSLSEEEE